LSHDDWLETYWIGLIDRLTRGQTPAALCVEPEMNAMSIIGFVTATRQLKACSNSSSRI
jgi:hypothetical protein